MHTHLCYTTLCVCVCVCVCVFELVHWRPPLLLFCSVRTLLLFSVTLLPLLCPLLLLPLLRENTFSSRFDTINFDPVQGWVMFAPSLFSLSSPFLSVNPSKMDGISVRPSISSFIQSTSHLCRSGVRCIAEDREEVQSRVWISSDERSFEKGNIGLHGWV